MSEKHSLSGEYSQKGEYHRHLNKKWRYYPVYMEKIAYVKKYLNSLNKQTIIVDLGCGEGLLVEEYHAKGYTISGVDMNFASKNVAKGDLTKLDIKSGTYDCIICLDVLEHLSFSDQEKSILEMRRILKPGGRALISIPNLAHLASRISFLLSGSLIRTSEVERHIGDRPIAEYLSLFKRHGFVVTIRKGLFPTFPIISLLTYFLSRKIPLFA